DCHRLRAARNQSWRATGATTTATAIRPLRYTRHLRPGHEVLVDLTHELLITRIERLQERRLGAVPLVERQPREVNPVRDGAVVEFQSDLGLEPVSHRGGDPRRAAPG